MSEIMRVLNSGLPKKLGSEELNLSPPDQAILDLGIHRLETDGGMGPLSEREKEIYFSAFFSALTIAGEIIKGARQDESKRN